MRDTGIGIPLNKQEQIFQEFRQESEGLSRNFEGTGLGLTLTKRYVELLCGSISVESEVGIGSIFSIVIPNNIKGGKISSNELKGINKTDLISVPITRKNYY